MLGRKLLTIRHDQNIIQFLLNLRSQFHMTMVYRFRPHQSHIQVVRRVDLIYLVVIYLGYGQFRVLISPSVIDVVRYVLIYHKLREFRQFNFQ